MARKAALLKYHGRNPRPDKDLAEAPWQALFIES